MLIRLVPNWVFSSKRLRLAPSVVERGIGCRLCRSTDAEQALERVEWEEPPVEAKRELVEIRLKVLRRDAMVNAIEPGLQVAEDKVDERQVLFRNVGIAALRDLREPVALLCELDVARPVVGRDVRTWLHRVNHEALKRFRRAVRSDVQTQAPSVEATTTRECLARIPCPLVLFALALLDRAHDQRLVVLSAPLAARAAPDPRLIDLNREVTANAVAIRAHHRYTQLVQDLEGRFVALQTELPLELHSAHARRLARHEVRSPKPDRDRRVRALHDRAGRERCVTLAVAQRSTTEARFEKRLGSPCHLQYWQTKPSGHRIISKYAAHAASSGKSRMKSGRDVGNGSLATTVPK